MDDIEQLDADAATEILDAIPEAYEQALEGLAQAERGEVITLEDLGQQ
jgi:hypothetical protein